MKYVPIFHFGRTGSTVMAAMLDQHRDVVSLGEVYTKVFADKIALATSDDFINVVTRHPKTRASTAKVCFFELKNMNLRNGLTEVTLEPLLADFRAAFGDNLILLRRRNTLRRIVSNLRAAQTKVYHRRSETDLAGDQKSNFALPIADVFDFSTRAKWRTLVQAIEKAEAIEAAVSASVKTIFPGAVEIWYEEDLEVDPCLGARKVLDSVGLPRVELSVPYAKTSGGLRSDISNYDDVERLLRSTRYGWMLG